MNKGLPLALIFVLCVTTLVRGRAENRLHFENCLVKLTYHKIQTAM